MTVMILGVDQKAEGEKWMMVNETGRQAVTMILGTTLDTGREVEAMIWMMVVETATEGAMRITESGVGVEAASMIEREIAVGRIHGFVTGVRIHGETETVAKIAIDVGRGGKEKMITGEGMLQMMITETKTRGERKERKVRSQVSQRVMCRIGCVTLLTLHHNQHQRQCPQGSDSL